MATKALQMFGHFPLGFVHLTRRNVLDQPSSVRALVEADDAGDLEAAQGFAHRSSADPELQRQLAFGRQLVARTQRSCGHLAANLFADFLEYALGADRREAWL